MEDALTETCARALIRHWIARFGVPDDLISDRGPQFTSHLWAALNKLLGISASTTTAYHPQANGIVERFHRQLKASLKARLCGPNWMDKLPLVLLGIRSVWREDTGCYGTGLHVPGEFFLLTRLCQVRRRIRSLQPSSSVSFSTHCVPLYPHLLNSMASTRPMYRTTSPQQGSSTSVMMPIMGHYSAPTQDHSRSLRRLRNTSSLTSTAAGMPCQLTDSKWPTVRRIRTSKLLLQHRRYQRRMPSCHRLPHALAGLSGPHSVTASSLPARSQRTCQGRFSCLVDNKTNWESTLTYLKLLN